MEFQPTTVCKHLFIPSGTGNRVSGDSRAKKKPYAQGWRGDSHTLDFCFTCVDVWSDVPLRIWRPQTWDLAQPPPEPDAAAVGRFVRRVDVACLSERLLQQHKCVYCRQLTLTLTSIWKIVRFLPFRGVPSHSTLSLCRLSLHDCLVWQECNPRRGGGDGHHDHTLATLRSLDKWIIRPLRLWDARPITAHGFALLSVAVWNWGEVTLVLSRPQRWLSAARFSQFGLTVTP